jgi:hypothetical protein
MNALLYYDLTTKSLTDGSSAWTPPAMVFGESLQIGLRFQETLAGTQSEVGRVVRYLKAASGVVDARPVAGAWRLKLGSEPQSAANTTAPLPFNAGAQALQSAINALPAVTALYGQAAVSMMSESYLIKFGTGAVEVPLFLVGSQLHPPCFEQVNAWQVAGAWVSELRLCQAPVVFTDSSERQLPPPPSITRIQQGGSDGIFEWNEIQQMAMPPDFQGSYQFKRNNIRTALLSPADGNTEIAAALSIYGSSFAVTNPRDGIARIEFTGDFKGVPQPLLEVIVADAPEGDLTFALELDKPPLAAMLRTREEVALPLEIEIGIEDDSIAGGVAVHKIRTEITIQRGVIFPMLATAAGIDWLRPVPKDYVPFMRDQVITGQQFYACALGDGEAVEFVVDHNLATDAIAGVLLRENHADGRMLVQGTDYDVHSGGENSLTITLIGDAAAPVSEGLGLVITAAGPRAVFQAHTHTMDQVVGLDGILEQIGTRLEVLEAYLPSTSPSVPSTGAAVLKIEIPEKSEVIGYTAPLPEDLSTLPRRAPFLLPAIHLATGNVAALPSPLPSPAANTVWSAAVRTQIPGGGQIRASWVEAGGFVASDGRILYPAAHAASTTSYYPLPFERTLFEFAVNEKMLRVNRTLKLEFGVAAQLIHATSEAQWVCVIEAGTPTSQTAPAPTGQNLEDVVWGEVPLLSQPLLITPLATTHTFGCRIRRTADGIVADRLLYGDWEAATDAAPASANFALRARLIRFDTKNNAPMARGWLSYTLGDKSNPTTATIS